MIDAAIPLQAQAPQVPPIIGQMVALKNAGIQQQQAQQNLDTGAIRQQGDQLALSQAGQSAQDQADVRAAYAAAMKPDPVTGQMTMDRGTLLNTIGKLNPQVGAQMQSQLATQDTATAEAKTKLAQAQADTQAAQIKAATAHVSAVDQLLQGVNDQPTWTAALQNAQNLGIVKPGELPQQYDPQLVARLHANALTQKEVLANQQAAQDEKDKAAQASATLANTQSYQKAEIGLRSREVGIQGGELALKQNQAGMGTNGAPSDLATAIAQGHISPDRLGYLLSKNPALIQGVMQADPSFDSSKAQAYPAVYKDFTSSKTNSAGGALNAGGTALQHLQTLQQLNTIESRIPGTSDHQKYQNQLDTLAPELAKFYGDSTVSGIQSYKSTLGAVFNRDAAIRQQAESMGKKMDSYQQTWQNAAPSKAYEAPMPGMSPAAMAARAALDPSYKQGGASSGMVTVQIPGSPPGKIPAAALQKFKADHPNAQVTQ